MSITIPNSRGHCGDDLCRISWRMGGCECGCEACTTAMMPYRIYHWDTFEPDPVEATTLVGGAYSLTEAEELVDIMYGDRICENGADQVRIVGRNDFEGVVVRTYNIR